MSTKATAAIALFGALLSLILGCHVGGSRSSAARAQPEAGPSTTAAAAAAAATKKMNVGTEPGHVGSGTPLTPREGAELAAFAAGCFWGVEDAFRQVPGVLATAVGYTGGHTDAPTYPLVCSHTTGHAEAVLVEFDPKLVTYDTLLDVFFKHHDPTTKNRQGPDIGDQYRSAVFYFSPSQEAAVRTAIAREQPHRARPIVTEVSPIARFWRAEDYHQQYDEKTGTHSCPLPQR